MSVVGFLWLAFRACLIALMIGLYIHSYIQFRKKCRKLDELFASLCQRMQALDSTEATLHYLYRELARRYPDDEYIAQLGEQFYQLTGNH